MAINAILEGATGDLELLGNLPDGHDLIGLGILEREIGLSLGGPRVAGNLSLTCPTHYQGSPKKYHKDV